jgi:putative nucleotidyltransferase with HDIG domain
MAINNLKEKIQNIIHLPALPAVAMEVVSIIENPKTDVHTLSNLISKDQVLASKILKIANSPFYGYSKTISTLDFAIVILGFDTLKDAVLSVALISHLNKNVSKDFDMNAFWNHSIATSIVARELARSLNYKAHMTEAFVGGLIHDIGLLVLNQYFRKEFEEVIAITRSENVTILEAERKILGSTHDEVGSWLAQRWNFPKGLIEIIKYHHNPDFAVLNKQLSVIVHFADVLAHRITSCEFPLEQGIKIRSGLVEMFKQPDEEFLNVFMQKNETMINNEIEKIKNFVS